MTQNLHLFGLKYMYKFSLKIKDIVFGLSSENAKKCGLLSQYLLVVSVASWTSLKHRFRAPTTRADLKGG